MTDDQTAEKDRRRPSRFGGMTSLLRNRGTLETVLGPGEATDAVTPADGAPPGLGPATGGGKPAVADVASSGREPSPSPSTVASAPTPTAAPDATAGPAPGKGRGTPASAAASSLTPTGRLIEARPLADIRPSPFQPAGRPSAAAVEAVAQAIRTAGSLEALVGSEGAPIFARLDAEAARLAELAFDIATRGVKDPIETRIAEDGGEECLSGHRRIAAARLAGLDTVPVLSRGEMSSANAAATVLSGNLHRENFTPWQEAVLVAEVRERRTAERMPADMRTLGRVMGWASGKVQARIKLRRALSDRLLERLGDVGLVEGINRIGAKDLNRIADTPDEGRRLDLLRRALGVGGERAVSPPGDGAVVGYRPRRGGGFVLEVRQEIETMTPEALATVREALDAQLVRVTAREQALSTPQRQRGR